MTETTSLEQDRADVEKKDLAEAEYWKKRERLRIAKQKEHAERNLQQRRERKNGEIEECEGSLAVFTPCRDAVAELSADALHRCGAGGVGVLGGPNLPPTTALPEMLGRAVASAEKRLSRLREELAALQG